MHFKSPDSGMSKHFRLHNRVGQAAGCRGYIAFHEDAARKERVGLGTNRSRPFAVSLARFKSGRLFIGMFDLVGPGLQAGQTVGLPGLFRGNDPTRRLRSVER
jgi:hypothetical protein